MRSSAVGALLPLSRSIRLVVDSSAAAGLEKKRLLEADALQLLLTASMMLTALGECHVQQRLVSCLFRRAGRLRSRMVWRSWKSAETWSRMSFLKRRITKPLSRKSSGV